MRVLENPGRSIEVETGARRTVLAERVSPFAVRVMISDRGSHAAELELEHHEGMAFLSGLAELYGCRAVDN